MDRIKRYGEEMMARDRSLFGLSFEDNKRAIAQISDIESKFLRNKIAGYITSVHRKEKIKLEESLSEAVAVNA